MVLEVRDPHWVDQYGSACFQWQASSNNGRTTYYRPLGLVEHAFDCDGRYYEGRADINIRLDLSVRTRLSRHERQRHIILSWACLRQQHIIACAKAPAWQSYMRKPQQITHDYCLQIDVPTSIEDALAQAESHITFLANANAEQFYISSQNSARVLDPNLALVKLFVLEADDGALSCIFIAAHEIGDGLSIDKWQIDFTRLLNITTESLEAELVHHITSDSIRNKLPLPQEALYPPVIGSRARQRWFWLLTRILRHVRKPLPAGFSNPLLRHQIIHRHVTPQFPDVLNYDRAPPTLSAPVRARMSQSATRRMATICREVKVSVGAGCFALAALLMMEFYEKQHPDIPLEKRKPFITGFPLNPRPFLVGNPSADSLMLAFSDGIWLPFLPSSLDLEGRLRLLARTAQRQLAVYQKRTSTAIAQEGLQYMSSRGAGRVLAVQYLGSFERCEMLLPAEKRIGSNPQGAYPMRPNATRQTCGVSSVGKVPPLNTGLKHENQEFVAKALAVQPSVRPREGEFLVGISGSDLGIATSISVDDTSMDPDLVREWLHRFEHILEPQETAKL